MQVLQRTAQEEQFFKVVTKNTLSVSSLLADSDDDIADDDKNNKDEDGQMYKALVCPRCKSDFVREISVQRRAGDEASSSIMLCKVKSCRHRWVFR